jgi:hypothetical protein
MALRNIQISRFIACDRTPRGTRLDGQRTGRFEANRPSRRYTRFTRVKHPLGEARVRAFAPRASRREPRSRPSPAQIEIRAVEQARRAMSSTAEREPAQVAQVSLSLSSLAKANAKQMAGSRFGGLRSSSGLVTLRAILRDALPEKKPRRKSEEPGAKHSAALVAALVVYSGVAWL